MKDLTNEEKATLLAQVKSFCDITWDDERTDNKLWRMIVSSISFLDTTAGYELNYLVDEDTEIDEGSGMTPTFLSLCHVGKDLLLNRVFYDNEKALDDFNTNYVSLLNRLYLEGHTYDRETSAS